MAERKWSGPWRLMRLMDHPRGVVDVWVRPYRTRFWGMRVTNLHYGPKVFKVWS